MLLGQNEKAREARPPAGLRPAEAGNTAEKVTQPVVMSYPEQLTLESLAEHAERIPGKKFSRTPR